MLKKKERGSSPTEFAIKFSSGDSIGIEVHSESIPNQITIYQGQIARRIVAPELKAWIENDWQQE